MLTKLSKDLRFQRDSLSQSARDLRSIRVLTAAAMLLALNVVLSYFGAFYVMPELKISTSFLALSATAYLLGPVPAALAGGLADVIQYFLRPVGPFFPGFMISGILNGFIYGACLFRREGRALMIGIPLSKLLVNLFVNIGLNTLWLHLLQGKPYVILLSERVLKNVLLYPVEVALMFALTLFLARNKRRLLPGGR